MSITKNVLLNWYSSMKKKLRKIRIIFDIENWLWKSRGWVILHFLTAHHQSNSQNSKISFWYVDSQAKTFPILYPSRENSTTGNAIVVLELVWSSPFLFIIPKTGKPWNLFSPISLVNYHFFSFSLVSYHFFRKMIYVEGRNEPGT